MSAELSEAYRRRKMVSVIGGQAPLPVFHHRRLGYGLDSPKNLIIGQLEHGDPVRVIRAAHVADLMGALL